jgi:hypothetical protein
VLPRTVSLQQIELQPFKAANQTGHSFDLPGNTSRQRYFGGAIGQANPCRGDTTSASVAAGVELHRCELDLFRGATPLPGQKSRSREHSMSPPTFFSDTFHPQSPQSRSPSPGHASPSAARPAAKHPLQRLNDVIDQDTPDARERYRMLGKMLANNPDFLNCDTRHGIALEIIGSGIHKKTGWNRAEIDRTIRNCMAGDPRLPSGFGTTSVGQVQDFYQKVFHALSGNKRQEGIGRHVPPCNFAKPEQAERLKELYVQHAGLFSVAEIVALWRTVAGQNILSSHGVLITDEHAKLYLENWLTGKHNG